MGTNKTLALILAGGTGGRMGILTDVRAKPALPYAGVYRLVDFPLSNCAHSGITDVWIVEQYQPQSLNEHLANGRPWDLDRTRGGLLMLQPYQTRDDSAWHQGNADAIYQHKGAIQRLDPDILLVLSADHVYKLDYSKVIAQHLERDADVTMVTKRVPLDQAGDHGTAHVDDTGRVTGFEYKPDSPSSDLVTTEVFVYDAKKLMSTLDDLAEHAEEGLEDFGQQLLPYLVEQGSAYEYRLEGYWMDVGVPWKYWQSHMGLLQSEPGLDLNEKTWPILTLTMQHSPAHVYSAARIDNSLISPGCTVRGEVVRSVLSPGVTVAEGACVRDSIIFHDTVIESGATVDCTIVDKYVRIGAGATVGERRKGEGVPKDIAMIGRGATVVAGATVPADGEIPPVSS